MRGRFGRIRASRPCAEAPHVVGWWDVGRNMMSVGCVWRWWNTICSPYIACARAPARSARAGNAGNPLKKSSWLRAGLLPRLGVGESSANLLIRLRFSALILDKTPCSRRQSTSSAGCCGLPRRSPCVGGSVEQHGDADDPRCRDGASLDRTLRASGQRTPRAGGDGRGRPRVRHARERAGRGGGACVVRRGRRVLRAERGRAGRGRHAGGGAAGGGTGRPARSRFPMSGGHGRDPSSRRGGVGDVPRAVGAAAPACGGGRPS